MLSESYYHETAKRIGAPNSDNWRPIFEHLLSQIVYAKYLKRQNLPVVVQLLSYSDTYNFS